MDPVENMLRWAWYYDFGTTPEDSLNQLWGRRPRCDLSTSHFHMSLDELLDKFYKEIVIAGTANNIDPRAIAGAIAWEYEENLQGRLSDYLQYNRGGNGSLRFGDGIGWGSIHTELAQKLRPGASDFRLQCLRLEAASAITLVAETMNRAADRYFEKTGGVWIRNAPAVLAMFFNSSDAFLERSAEKRKLDACEPGKQVTLVIEENEMASWVQKNLDRFTRFETTPSPPAGHYAAVGVKGKPETTALKPL